MAQKTGQFRAFYWGIIRVVHRGCSFVELARRLNLLVHPQVIEVPKERHIPFYSVLDGYFVEHDLASAFAKDPIPDLEIYRISADFDQQRTLIFGGSSDEVLNQTVRHPKLQGRAIRLYARPDFEYIPVQAVNREELDVIAEVFEKLAKDLEGNAMLDTVGKVATFQEWLFWKRSIAPEPANVPGLTREETRILESAIAYGYYKTPREITLDELAKRLSMTKSTLNLRLRSIEEKIVNSGLYTQLARQP